jgi:hypothetical protein
MHSTGTQGADDAAMERLWLQVCASRGTPAPNRAQCGWLLQDLGADERCMLENRFCRVAEERTYASGEHSLTVERLQG